MKDLESLPGRVNAFGQRLRNDAPELPGDSVADFELDDELKAELEVDRRIEEHERWLLTEGADYLFEGKGE